MRLVCAVSQMFAYWTFRSLCTSYLSSSVASRAFSACAMRVFDVLASSSPLGYPCAKFRFCRVFRCWASPRRKIAHSITHSPSLFESPGTEAFVSEFVVYIYKKVVFELQFSRKLCCWFLTDHVSNTTSSPQILHTFNNSMSNMVPTSCPCHFVCVFSRHNFCTW